MIQRFVLIWGFIQIDLVYSKLIINPCFVGIWIEQLRNDTNIQKVTKQTEDLKKGMPGDC